MSNMEARMYEALHSDFGLKREWLGKKVTDRGVTYTITGLNPRSKKFPVTTNTGVRFSAEYLAALITDDVDSFRKKRDVKFQKELQRELKEARADFLTGHKLSSIPKEWLDKTFKQGRKTYTVVGLRHSFSHPIVVTDNNGKVFYFGTDAVRAVLSAAA